MKVVLDTNVLISGLFFSGAPHEVLKAWRDGRVRLVMSPEIFEEYERVGWKLSESFPGVDVSRFLGLLATGAETVEAHPLDERVCDDIDDDKFVACALASKSTCIVSGDKHLLKASGYGSMPVLKPRDFVNRYLRCG